MIKFKNRKFFLNQCHHNKLKKKIQKFMVFSVVTRNYELLHHLSISQCFILRLLRISF